MTDPNVNCRHCHRPVREIPAHPPTTGTHWVHETGEFSCRDSDGKFSTLDMAEPSRGYPLDDLAAARDAYEGSYAMMEAAREQFLGLIRESARLGISLQQIADASGTSVDRIDQIRNEQS